MISLFEFYDRNSNYNPQLLNMDNRKVKYKDSPKLLGIEIDNQLKHTFLLYVLPSFGLSRDDC